ncbi:pre-peptidase C-terminal domain-containing protein [uncultured Brevundimonas sp.]|uniref:pre-peptidase C-terminal domain-containing protein n=1 Tax=uncultured Brevundimonas sp. TaxID=213418 RepID=UPI0030ECF2CD|tara:strand:- start:6642 stop:8942 length:2301 start_codon:yes stop_codon:yes gene_type:complete
MLRTILYVTTALTLMASPVLAQEPLRLGGEVTGELRSGDEQLSSGEFVDTYEYTGRAGQQIGLRLTSDDFDPYLIVRGPGDFSEDNDDASDDDRGALLNLRLPADGTYRVSATSFQSGERGTYRLRLVGGSIAMPQTSGSGGNDGAAQVQLNPGVTRGELDRGDQTLSSGEYVDRFALPVRRGQTYDLSLSADGFDPYLMVRGPGDFSEDNDDDPARRGTRDSRIRFTAPADGEATVAATSYAGGETGSYVLSLDGRGTRPGVARAASETTSLRLGETREGWLSPSDSRLESGEYINTFVFDGRRGQRLDLRLTSGDFDPYLAISGPNDFSDFNDDADGTTDSRLRVTLPADGPYRIVATSYAAGEMGPYQLSVLADTGPTRAEPASRPDERASAGGRITVGQTVAGTLGSGDETLDSGEYVDTYRFTGQRGQRVAVELTSSAFDAYTILRTPSGEQRENDDGEDGTDSRLETVLTEDGDYEVMVTSYAAGETGSYRFSVNPSRGSARQASVQSGARVFAVMVGVSDYGGAQNDLPYTDEDARKLGEVLEREGVLNPASVVLTNAQATVGGVRSAFARVAAEAGPDDMFLFFFSGHGDQADTAVSGVEPDGRSESIVLRDGQISDVEMSGLFASLHTRLSLLVLDSCFSGGFARNVVDRPGVMGLFSSEEDLTSAVAEKFRAGGYLSHFLRTGMAGEADGDGDHLVTAGELATYLRRQFVREVDDVESETADGQRNYQNLVIDRGGVQVDDVILRLAAAETVSRGN